MTQDDEAKELRKKIEGRVKNQIADLRFFAAGQNANLYLVDLDDDRRLMCKVLHRKPNELSQADLEVEGWMLQYLKRHSKLPLPNLYWYDSTTMLMDFVVGSGLMDRKTEEDAADKLAALHSVETKFFGLERDTSIAALNQPNHFELDWTDFFRDYRLMAASMAALNEGLINLPLMNKIEKLAGKIEIYMGTSSRPSLIHGDLWEGNIVIGDGQVQAFLDPAIYYADPEMELAMIDLYGTFGEAFFNRYNELRPIAPDFYDTRRDIYALYPLLTKIRLNRLDLVGRVEEIVHRFTG